VVDGEYVNVDDLMDEFEDFDPTDEELAEIEEEDC